MIIYYSICFIFSFLLTVFYVYRHQKHFDVNITCIFLLIPIVDFGYVYMYTAQELGQALLATRVTYIGGCLLPYFITFSILSLCEIEVKPLVRTLLFACNSLMLLTTFTMGKNPYFYKSVSLQYVDGIMRLKKDYGPMHTVFYIMVGLYCIAGIATIIYTYFKKSQVSRKTLFLLFLPEILSVIGFFGARMFNMKVELVTTTFLFAQLVYLLIAERIALYRTSDMAIETMLENGSNAFINLDFSKHYLGSNETAKEIFPSLRSLAVDSNMNKDPELKKTVLDWVKHFEENEAAGENQYLKRDKEHPENEKFYFVRVDYLYNGRSRKGYQIFLLDDTKNQQYIKLLDGYNSELEEEVEKKTQSIVKMHDNLVISMATMVESRDNSTGGHIKRTSEGVRILIGEIVKLGDFGLSEEFCRNIIKAAPMHDLGKIAVDDAVLRKPGRFTPEEYEEMKKHAKEGARIVHEILRDTEDEAFRRIAENVAHYHHERYDGSGYPDGLKGEEIPLEARIMAIADVYDALVSKRVYKERMSFETADKIIMEGMGTHFDAKLKEAYENARPKLEAYYKSLDD